MVTRKSSKANPGWSDVKIKLADLERNDLIGLVQSLYAANKDNKTFLHTRFGLGDDPLDAYKEAIIGWINPPDFHSRISVSKAKKAISDYKKALGQPKDLAELTIFYCEEALDFLAGCGMDDEGFHMALVRMFEQALKYVRALPKAQQAEFLARLDQVREEGQDIGWGVGDDFDLCWSEAGLKTDP